MKVIDAFTYFNEAEMLEFRLRLLYPYVDQFIIVEANRTFSGKEKPFYYEENKDRFKWAADKIYNYKIDAKYIPWTSPPKEFDPKHPCWNIEHDQRNSIVLACNNPHLGLEDDDLLMMGDIDEIPLIDSIEWAKKNMRSLPAVCQQDFFYYDLRYLRQEEWCGTIFSSLRTAKSIGAQELRNRRNILPRMLNAGWHLSNFTSTHGIQEKIKAFSHQEFNTPEFLNEEHIMRCIFTGKDLFKRDVKTKEVPPEFFPVYFREKAKKYKWGI